MSGLDGGVLCRFQIGAYDQQIWEKSVEQREIKVRDLRAAPDIIRLLRFALPAYVFCLFYSVLFDRGGHPPVLCPPALHLHVDHLFFFFIRCFARLQLISRVSSRQGGRVSKAKGWAAKALSSLTDQCEGGGAGSEQKQGLSFARGRRAIHGQTRPGEGGRLGRGTAGNRDKVVTAPVRPCGSGSRRV